jgi:hypothetical protein
MPDKYDPDERFSLHPMEGEEVIKKLLGDDEEADPDDVEPDDS